MAPSHVRRMRSTCDWKTAPCVAMRCARSNIQANTPGRNGCCWFGSSKSTKEGSRTRLESCSTHSLNLRSEPSKPVGAADLARFVAPLHAGLRRQTPSFPIGDPRDAVSPRQHGELLLAAAGRPPRSTDPSRSDHRGPGALGTRRAIAARHHGARPDHPLRCHRVDARLRRGTPGVGCPGLQVVARMTVAPPSTRWGETPVEGDPSDSPTSAAFVRGGTIEAPGHTPVSGCAHLGNSAPHFTHRGWSGTKPPRR